MKRSAIVAALVALALPTAVYAGGFEFPDNGTEALGRGAAFTAKADDPTAIQYNVAGLARQRGTKLLFDSNLVFNRYEFTRAGVYPDSPMDAPYGGMPFPKVSSSGVFYAPFLGITTDFGKLDRWTFAIGGFGPSSVGDRDFGAVVHTAAGDLPAPQRYDIVKANLLLFYPTLAVGFRATHWLDLGVALHLVYGTFDLSNVSFTDLGPTLCSNLESAKCDSTTRLRVSGITATAALGAMFHPSRFLDIGVNVRGPANLDASGTVDATAPSAAAIPIPQDKAEFHTHLPWVVRAGLRYIFRGADDFEHGDIELDGTYEAWGSAEGDGSKINIPNLGPFSDIHPTITHHYRDTFSARLGGAYNIRLPAGVLSLRLGAYFDSAATHYKDTRVDFDTMAKYAGTGGIGYTVRGVTLAVAYAYIYEPDRTITNGDIQSINGVANGDTNTVEGPTPVVNNGHYHAQNQVLSLGLTIAWDELLKKHRKVNW
jgi:long-subunit fatty acid transport protein